MAQLVNAKHFDGGEVGSTLDDIARSGFFFTSFPTVESDHVVSIHNSTDFTVDKGKGPQNPSRDEKERKYRREESQMEYELGQPRGGFDVCRPILPSDPEIWYGNSVEYNKKLSWRSPGVFFLLG